MFCPIFQASTFTFPSFYSFKFICNAQNSFLSNFLPQGLFHQKAQKWMACRVVAIQHLQYFNIYLVAEKKLFALLLCIAAVKDSKEKFQQTRRSILTSSWLFSVMFHRKKSGRKKLWTFVERRHSSSWKFFRFKVRLNFTSHRSENSKNCRE